MMTDIWMNKVLQTPKSNQSLFIEDSHFKRKCCNFDGDLIFWKGNWQFLIVTTRPTRCGLRVRAPMPPLVFKDHIN